MQEVIDKLQELKSGIKDKLMDNDSNKKLNKTGIGVGTAALIICAGVGVMKYNAYSNKKPDVLIGKMYEYMAANSYSAEIDSEISLTCTFNKFSLPMSTTLTIEGNIDSDGNNKYTKLKLNGDLSTALGNDKYEDTSVQIYSDSKNAYYGIGDEFTWKKAGKSNIMEVSDTSSQEALLSLKKISKEEFEKAFSDTSVKEKDGKVILSGKFNLAQLRNSKIKDQLYVMYGMNDVDSLIADVTITFSGTTPVEAKVNVDTENTASVDEMYEKMGITSDDGDYVAETTDTYDQMNIDQYISDDDSLGDMTTEIKGSITLSFDKLNSDISMPDMAKETDTNDVSDVPREWCGLNNTINYLFIGGTK